MQEEGQSAPELISHEDLSEMIGNAEAIPYMLEYAEADKRFSLEQEQTTKEIERQQKKAEKEAQRIVKEQERIAAKQTAEEEQKRIAEEIKNQSTVLLDILKGINAPVCLIMRTAIRTMYVPI